MKKSRSIVLTFFVLVIFCFSSISQTQIFVDGGNKKSQNGSITYPFSTIQDAIDVAEPGDIIKVLYGTYSINASILVDVEDVQIIGVDGAKKTYVYQTQQQSNHHGFHVTADNVTIEGFTIYGAYSWDWDEERAEHAAGILLDGVQNCSIRYNTIGKNKKTECSIGIALWGSDNNTIYGNSFQKDRVGAGIFLVASSNNIIYSNVVTRARYYGLSFHGNSDNNLIARNKLIAKNYPGYGVGGDIDTQTGENYFTGFGNQILLNDINVVGEMDLYPQIWETPSELLYKKKNKRYVGIIGNCISKKNPPSYVYDMTGAIKDYELLSFFLTPLEQLALESFSVVSENIDVNAGSELLFSTQSPSSSELSFASDNWQGFLSFGDNLTSQHTVEVSMGYILNGTFNAIATKDIIGNGSNQYGFEFSNDSFVIPVDGEIAMRVSNVGSSSFSLSTGSILSSLSPPKKAQIINLNYIWSGYASNSWFDDKNWNNKKVPTSSDDIIVVKGSNNLIVSGMQAECKDLILKENSEIIIEPNALLEIKGCMKNGKDSEGVITILSDAKGSGSLIHEDGDVAVVVKQYVPAGGAIIGAPVRFQNPETHFEDIETVTGESSMGIDIMNDMFMRWDEHKMINGYMGVWTDLLTPVYGVSPMATENFEEGKGYYLSYRHEEQIIVFEGNTPSSNVSIDVTHTATSSNPGCNFISNPYVSTISGNRSAGNKNFLKDNSDILDDNSTAIYIWDASNNTYTTVSNATSAFLLRPGQAFMVKVSEDGDVDFKSNIRKYEDPDSKEKSLMETRITVFVENSNGLIDKTDIFLGDEMTTYMDKGFDAQKMYNEDMNIFSNMPSKEEGDYAILALPTTLSSNLSIPIQMDVLDGGRFTFSFDIDNLSNNLVFFKDNLTGELINIKRIESLKVDLFDGLTEGRFEIVIKPVGGNIFSLLSDSQGKALKGIISGIDQGAIVTLEESCFGDISVYNLTGQIVYEGTINGELTKTIGLNVEAGVYIVKLQDTQGKILKEKIYVK